jgi:hypothetical protein
MGLIHFSKEEWIQAAGFFFEAFLVDPLNQIYRANVEDAVRRMNPAEQQSTLQAMLKRVGDKETARQFLENLLSSLKAVG